MAQDLKNINKLIILYLLHKVEFSLTRIQLYNFLLNYNYTNFQLLQEALLELEETNMIENQLIAQRSFVTITEEGIATLQLLEEDLNSTLKKDIDQNLYKKKLALQNELSINATYDKSTLSNEYEAHLTAIEGNVTLIDLTISIPTQKLAESVCKNWKKKSESIYQYLTEQLF